MIRPVLSDATFLGRTKNAAVIGIMASVVSVRRQ